MKTFIDQCVLGEASPDQINDFSEKYRRSGSHLKLHEYLGLSKDEYISYVSQVFTIEEIIKQRKGQPSEESFISQCLKGMTRPEFVDDFIEMWHRSQSKTPLFEYLGMRLSEYNGFVELRMSVHEIVNERRLRRS